LKTVTQDYIDEEEKVQRRPVELYHLWRDGQDWYYTSGDIPVIFETHTYNPATIERGSVSYNAQIDLTSMKIKVGYLEDSTLEFIAMNPVKGIWVSVMKLHRDQTSLEADVIFLGQLKTVLFKGVTASITCVGFEHFLKKVIPLWRYQTNCNHQVFDSKCALVKSLYVTTTTISLDSTGLILTSADFGLQADGYFVAGGVVYGDEDRTIVAHVGNDITMMYKMSTLVTGVSVDAYPGCDGRIETCRDKFDNIVNFLGFSFIPVENPALRVTW